MTNGADITIDSSATPGAQSPGFNLGGDTILGPVGDGTLNVDGPGSQVLVKGDQGFFSVGRLENGTGALNISNGGRVVMANADGQSSGFVGDRPGATGTITIDGSNSLLDVGNTLGVGVDSSFNDAGDGMVKLVDGGVIKADNLAVGLGGTLAGNGTVTASTAGATQNTVVNRGTIDVGESIGELTFDGDLKLEAGTILLEADSPTELDHINVGRDLVLAGGVIDVLLGFVPDSDFLFEPFDVTGAVNVTETFGGFNVLAAEGSGIGAGVPLTMSIGDTTFQAQTVPTPGTCALLLMGLVMLWANPELRRAMAARCAGAWHGRSPSF